MVKVVASAHVLREFGTGVSWEAIALSPAIKSFSVEDFMFLYHRKDSRDDSLALIVEFGMGGSGRSVIPNANWSTAWNRMASFVDRAAQDVSLSLPRAWKQYKYNSYISFFALPSVGDDAPRWIVEHDVAQRVSVFWRCATSSSPVILEEFVPCEDISTGEIRRLWLGSYPEAGAWHDETEASGAPMEIALTADFQHAPSDSYEGWMTRVTQEQREFIEAPSNESIRLRGPAGSGKSVAMMLKAVREVLECRDQGEEVRILYLTHSWALAETVDGTFDNLLPHGTAEISTFPLMEIADAIAPFAIRGEGVPTLMGDDSFSSKQAQLDQIEEVLWDFRKGDLLTLKDGVSPHLQQRLENPEQAATLALCWDLLIEFGSVIGAAGIFPGAGSESRYLRLPRANWMLPLESTADRRVVYQLYVRYMEQLERRHMLTYDQVLADLLSYLVTYTWNRKRRDEGYDLIFVDEFHLFTPLERQVINMLSRDVDVYPRIFLALDPRQSPSSAFIGTAADETESEQGSDAAAMGDLKNFDLTIVHRFSPEILELVKHIHKTFPALDFGSDWNLDFQRVESIHAGGSVPRLVRAADIRAEKSDLLRDIHGLYPHGTIAVVVVDERQWKDFTDLAGSLAGVNSFHVSILSSREDVEPFRLRNRGIIFAPAAFLAGLQVDFVLVVGLPDPARYQHQQNEMTRLLSLLYLAVSRAQAEVRIYCNEADGEVLPVLREAVQQGVLQEIEGSSV